MALHGSFDGAEPVRPEPIGRLGGEREIRLRDRSLVASGTLACPACDAPVSPGDAALTPAQPIACPFCAHPGVVRDFLSLAVPSRPARVDVRVRRAR